MCLAVPSKIVSIDGDMAKIDVSGAQREASLALLTDAEVGDYVIVHAGYAIHKIDEAAALESLNALNEVFAAHAEAEAKGKIDES